MQVSFFMQSVFKGGFLQNEKENRKYTALYGYGGISVRRLRIQRIHEHISIFFRIFVIRVISS